eukprot:TRINITY_DN4895_c0_g1_i5.p1 TRINITY_DN4895_c0_g1~~TRINITY_DN4895_c0_g1_i5.p1  ORF type:complete len:724 (+),score=176.31 TRINITY_DN4895_c0_g1_i5:70-2241(+)
MFFFFFFKQKTAYEMLRSLVGSEMCIRDSINAEYGGLKPRQGESTSRPSFCAELFSDWISNSHGAREVGMGQCASSKCCPRNTYTDLQVDDQYDLQVVQTPQHKYHGQAAEVECQQLRARIEELEAALEKKCEDEHLVLVHDTHGALQRVVGANWSVRCGSPASGQLWDKLFAGHLGRLWKRFGEIDTDGDGQIGDYDVREWVLRLESLSQTPGRVEQLMVQMGLEAGSIVDRDGFARLVCMRGGVVVLRTHVGELLEGEMEAPEEVVLNRLKRALHQIQGTPRSLVKMEEVGVEASVMLEHMLQAESVSVGEDQIMEIMRALDPKWTDGQTVGFTEWCKLCSFLRGKQEEAVSPALHHMWKEEIQQIGCEFEESWRPNSEGAVDERRIREMVLLLMGEGTAHQVQPKHVLRMLGCLGQGSVDLEAYLKLFSTISYQAGSSEREPNPAHQAPAQCQAAQCQGAQGEESLQPVPDPLSLTSGQLREMFGIRVESSSPGCPATIAGQDDTATAIARNVVGVERARTETEGYKLQKEKNGVQLFVSNPVKVGKSNISGVKIQTNVAIPAKLLFQSMCDPTTNFMANSTSKHQVVCELEDCEAGMMKLAHSKVHIPLFADQDFALGEFTGSYHGSYLYTFSSTKDRRVPGLQGRCVRGQILLGGWSFAPIGTHQTQITFVSLIDPNRTVPKAVMNQGHDTSAKSVISFVKNVKAHIKKHKINLDLYV